MTTSFFGLDQNITFEGADSANPFAFKHYNPDEIAAIPDAIPDLSRKLSYDSPPMPIWDNRIVFIVLVLLLVFEWAFRKKYKLI